MQELEFDSDTEGAPNGDDAGPTVVDLPTESGGARLRLPPGADDDEVAALVAAVATRLAAGDEAESTEPEAADRWRLAGRLGARRRYDLPRQCRRGGEWRAASRRP
jgi:hypothetical protein